VAQQRIEKEKENGKVKKKIKKKYKKRKAKKTRWKNQTRTLARHAIAISLFFIWPNSLKRYSFSPGEQEEM